MRIQQIVMKNFRQYRDFKLTFDRKENDLHVIIGKGGTGKTNFVNSLNWCLYGDEPHLSRDSQRMPRLNIKAIEGAKSEEKHKVQVDIVVEIENGAIIFSREEEYLVPQYEKNKAPQLLNTKFEITTHDKAGNSKFLVGDEADDMVEQFVPKDIREFFFFDGEKLDTYFRDATNQRTTYYIVFRQQPRRINALSYHHIGGQIPASFYLAPNLAVRYGFIRLGGVPSYLIRVWPVGQGHHVVHAGLLKRAPKTSSGVTLPTLMQL